MSSFTFQPGDIINFARGSIWDGEFVINDSGVEGNPITFKAYGTGTMPIFRNPGVNMGRAIVITGQWIVIEGLMIRDTPNIGVLIDNGADHNIVRDSEATAVGIGVKVKGQYNLITKNYVHDVIMVVNTPGGDDDYGANGVLLSAPNNEVSYNRFINCKQISYDY